MDEVKRKWNYIPDDARATLISDLTAELATLRAKEKLTQEELANAIGISRQTYSQIKCGKIKMSWSTYLAILFFYSTKESTAKLLEALGLYPNKYLKGNIE